MSDWGHMGDAAGCLAWIILALLVVIALLLIGFLASWKDAGVAAAVVSALAFAFWMGKAVNP